MSQFNKIYAGYELGLTSPVVAGLEDFLFIFNKNDFVLTYSTVNPLIVTGIAPATAPVSGTGPYLYQYTGTNNSFKSTSKSVKTTVGPRYDEEVDFNIADNNSQIKTQIMAIGYGRVCAIVVNNFKIGDAAIELFGANNGMLCTAEKDEASNGGWNIKLVPPDKLQEPYPPRSVSIAPVSGTATYASSLAAIQALSSF